MINNYTNIRLISSDNILKCSSQQTVAICVKIFSWPDLVWVNEGEADQTWRAECDIKIHVQKSQTCRGSENKQFSTTPKRQYVFLMFNMEQPVFSYVIKSCIGKFMEIFIVTVGLAMYCEIKGVYKRTKEMIWNYINRMIIVQSPSFYLSIVLSMTTTVKLILF